MRDIESRLQRYRLARYAPPGSSLPTWIRWVWVLIGLWGLWALAFSGHSAWRLWRLERDNERARIELERTQDELARLESGMRDPQAVRDMAEHLLREKTGMARPGEIVYRVRGAPADSVTPPGSGGLPRVPTNSRPLPQ
jgi:cell division protein FtsB